MDGWQDELGSPTWRLSDAFEREMLRLVGEGRLSLRDLTTSLGPALTSTTDARRADGTRLLSQTLARCPSAAVSSNELHFFAEFFASRLKDMACLEGVLRGLVALVRRRERPDIAPLSADDAREVAKQFLTVVHLPSVAFGPRLAGLELLLLLIRGYGDALMQSGVDVFDATITQIDGERDPRCLLVVADVLEALSQVSPSLQPAYESGGGTVHELHEVLSVYFPVKFTPLKDTDITREGVKAAVHRALTALPQFRPCLVPWLFEKLQGREDVAEVLDLLAHCVERFGASEKGMGDHEDALWAALRSEITLAYSEGLVASEAQARRVTAAAAEASFQRAIRAGMTGLVQRALRDALLMREMREVLERAGHWQYEEDRKLEGRVAAAGSLLRALCGGSLASCSLTLAAVVPVVVDVAQSTKKRLAAWPQQSTQALQWTLAIIQSLCDGIGIAIEASSGVSDAEHARDVADALAALARAVTADEVAAALCALARTPLQVLASSLDVLESIVVLSGRVSVNPKHAEDVLLLASAHVVSISDRWKDTSAGPDATNRAPDVAQQLSACTGALVGALSKIGTLAKVLLQPLAGVLDRRMTSSLRPALSCLEVLASCDAREAAQGAVTSILAAVETTCQGEWGAGSAPRQAAIVALLHSLRRVAGRCHRGGALLQSMPLSVLRALYRNPLPLCQARQELLEAGALAAFHGMAILEEQAQLEAVRAASATLVGDTSAGVAVAAGIVAGADFAEALQEVGPGALDGLHRLSTLEGPSVAVAAASQALAATLARRGGSDPVISEEVRKLTSAVQQSAPGAQTARSCHALALLAGALAASGRDPSAAIDALVHACIAGCEDGSSSSSLRACSALPSLFVMHSLPGALLSSLPRAFLWQQRLLSQTLGATASAAGDPALSLCALHVVAGCEWAAVKADFKRCWPMLVRGLAAVQLLLAEPRDEDVDLYPSLVEPGSSTRPASVETATIAGLKHVMAGLRDEAVRNALLSPEEPDLDALVHGLHGASRQARSASIRQAALEALRELATAAHSAGRWSRVARARAAVLQSLDASLDDPKRRVRLLAVQCKEAWGV